MQGIILHLVTTSSLALTISQTYLVCDDHLDSFEGCWLCTLQNVPLMNLSDSFLMTGPGLWLGG